MDWSNLFVMFVTFVLINNVVLNQFLGMCPFMGVSKKAVQLLVWGLPLLSLSSRLPWLRMRYITAY